MAAASKKGPDLALLLGVGKPKGKSEPDDDEGGGPSDEDADDMSGAFSTAAEEALDPEGDMESRKAALKRAIKACMEGDY